MPHQLACCLPHAPFKQGPNSYSYWTSPEQPANSSTIAPKVSSRRACCSRAEPLPAARARGTTNPPRCRAAWVLQKLSDSELAAQAQPAQPAQVGGQQTTASAWNSVSC